LLQVGRLLFVAHVFLANYEWWVGEDEKGCSR